MGKYYITFGQIHVHRVNGKTFDCDSLCEIEAETHRQAHDLAMDVFDRKFHNCHTAKKLPEVIHHYPRGVIKLEGH